MSPVKRARRLPRKTTSIRFSAAEHELFEIAAGNRGVTLSQWIRETCRQVARMEGAEDAQRERAAP